MADRAVYPANSDLSSEITLRLVTDGEHHVIDRLPDALEIVLIMCLPSQLMANCSV